MFGLLKDTSVAGKAGVLIRRPRDKVFDFIGVDFFKNYPRWSPEVIKLEQLTDGELGLGCLVRQVRVDQGNRTESVFKVTVYQPINRLSFEGVSNPFRCDYVLEPGEPASITRVTFTFELLSLELHMRPFEKLIRLAIQEGTERTLKNLKQLIEKEIAGP